MKLIWWLVTAHLADFFFCFLLGEAAALSFFFAGVSSGVGGLQTELGFFFAVKRGDVESLQSPGVC